MASDARGEAPDAKPSHWQELARQREADCRVFTVDRCRFRHEESGREGDFFVVSPAAWAVALARTTDGRYVLVRQFRFGIKALSWEFPSGCAEPGEDPIAAAARELQEESGYVSEHPVKLGVLHPNPAIQDNACTFVYFPDAHPRAETAWDEHEELEVALWTEAELSRAIREGTMTHALMLAGLRLLEAYEQNPPAAAE